MNQAFLPSSASILVFIGPSGSGKSTLAKELLRIKQIDITPTWTDRPLRSGESELEHKFVSPAQFDKLASENYFAHKPLTFFDLPYRYATPMLRVPPKGRIPTVMARVAALELIDRLYPNRILYQIEAPYNLILARLKEREKAGIKLGTRLSDYQNETKLGRKYANRVFTNNGGIDELVSLMKPALEADFKIVM